MSLKVVRRWLEACTSSHDCGIRTAETTLPSRLVHVGSSIDEVRLVRTAHGQGRYICLSHCWGGRETLKTTRANLASHMRSLPSYEIPKSFREAMDICRWLGVQYIWIDSLCIVQDDQNDWERESKAMCNIYENSYLTLAATSARNSEDGLFNNKNAAAVEVEGWSAEGVPYSLLAQQCLGHPEIYTGISDIIERWPLLSRAWVFQERLMSPRVLHFTNQELWWECRAETWCECGGIKSIGKDKYQKAIMLQTGKSLIQIWHDAIERYSELNMTMEADKLPALSGLASQMATRRSCHFLAGLWEDSLVIDMLWLGYGGTTNSTWRAPSWSWAAIQGLVRFPLSRLNHNDAGRAQLLKTYATVIDAKCILATADPYGRLLGGLVKISAPVMKGWAALAETVSPDPHFCLDICISSTNTTLEFRNLPGGPEDGPDYGDLFLDDEENAFGMGDEIHPCSDEFILVRMARVSHSNEYADGSDPAVTEVEYALVLIPLIGSNGLYKRIGVATQKRHLWKDSQGWKVPSCFDSCGGATEILEITIV